MSVSIAILIIISMGFVVGENNISCTDSDGGQNYNVKGTVSYGNWTRIDRCGSYDNNPSNNLNDLNEFYCRSDGEPVEEVYTCPNGCKDGACLKEITPACTDSDGGKNPYVKGFVKNKYFVTDEDVCLPLASTTGFTSINERYCNEDGTTGSYVADCPNICKDGACIKETTPTQCQTDSDCPQIMCVKAPCPGYKCINGKCELPKEEIKEQVKCVFDGSNQEQKCYTAEQNSRAYCSGKDVCVADISGYKGEKITWKSTCGGYAYTVIDGNNDYAKFDCKNIGTCQPTKCDDGTVYECKIYNGQCICPTCPPIIIKPVCGNGVCESGEGEICVAPMIACEKGKECKLPKPSCYIACPQDCKKTEGIYVNLNEKFKLEVYQSAKIRENNDNDILKITFKDLIAYKCKETEISASESQVIRANVASVTGNAISEATTTTSPSSGGRGEGVSIMKCIGAGPKALLEVETIVNSELGKNNIINLEVGEKKQVKDFTIYFSGYDYASRTGIFLVNKETFSCPNGCKCDKNGEIVICSNKTCGEKETLCPDGTCKNKCDINSEDCKYGCMYEGKCFPMGVRSNGLYCSDNLVMGSQKISDEKCENNFECSSNVCVSGNCISEGFINKIMSWFKKLFGG